MFLVVEDQLRVSEGWVRCGRCANVFNAVDDLIDVEQGTPVQLDIESLQAGARLGAAATPTTSGSGAAVPEQAIDHHPGRPGHGADVAWTLQPADEAPPLPPPDPSPRPSPHPSPHPSPRLSPAPFPEPSPVPVAAPPPPRPRPAAERPLPAAAGPSSLPADEPSDLPDHLLRAPSESFEDESVAPSSIGVSQGWSTLTPGDAGDGPDARRTDRPASLPPADAAPSFVREAERAQRWKRSPVRTALGVVAGLLLALAGLQTLLLWRDTVAAHVPGLAPALQAACAPLGCAVQPLRRIDRLAVDSSGLTRVDDGSNPADHRYRLAVLLHNKAGTALMAPAIELTLTDARGEIVARRVLHMADFGQPPAPIAAGQELPLRVLLATGPQRVEGYTVEIFYP